MVRILRAHTALNWKAIWLFFNWTLRSHGYPHPYRSQSSCHVPQAQWPTLEALCDSSLCFKVVGLLWRLSILNQISAPKVGKSCHAHAHTTLKTKYTLNNKTEMISIRIGLKVVKTLRSTTFLSDDSLKLVLTFLC